MMRCLKYLSVLTALPLLGLIVPGQIGPALAAHPAECYAAARQSEIEFPLPQVARAIAAKRLTILVVGAGSSSLPGPKGVNNAYPARLQAALTAKLPGVEVKVETNVKSRRRAADMVKTMAKSLSSVKPSLMIWQTATVDAMQGIVPGQFSETLEAGIDMARAAGADAIFVNPQYSPRTESMIALGAYVENMRWDALQREVPVFDRFEIMRAWADLGTFDLYSATKKLDMAERVHDCLGLLLADLIVEAAKPEARKTEGGR